MMGWIAQTIRHTLHQIGLQDGRLRRKPFLKMMHKEACIQFLADKQAKAMDFWNHLLWSDESKINLVDSEGVENVWWQPGEEYKGTCAMPTVKHGDGSVMAWGCTSAASTEEPQFIEGTMSANMDGDILNQSMSLSLRRLGPRAEFQHENDSQQTSKTTTALLKKLKVKIQNNVSSGQAVAVELILTLQLVLCYFASTDSHRSTGSPAIIIGVSVALGQLIGRYFTSCSMNPARSFGPAVIVGQFPQHWIFWVGPLAGAILASLLYNFVLYHDPKTCAQRLAILKGSYDSEELEKDGGQRAESLSLPSLVHRL